LWLLPAVAPAQPPKAPDRRAPALRLQASGPTAAVTSLAFGVDPADTNGLVLYASGFDKVVRTWVLGKAGTFEPGRRAYRVPIGSGTEGVINALAVSADGLLLAAAGMGLTSESPGPFKRGIIVPSAGEGQEETLKEQGTIFLFDTAGEKVRRLKAHLGPVLALAFVPHPGKSRLLVSVGRDETKKQSPAVACLWDADTGALLATSPDLPSPGAGRPGLGIWRTGRGPTQLRVAISIAVEQMRVWDVEANEVQAVGEQLALNEPTAFLPDDENATRGTLLTAGFRPAKEPTTEAKSYLRAWPVAAGAALNADDAPLQVLEDSNWSTSALVGLRAGAGGRVDRAALVRRSSQDSQPRYGLQLVDLGAGLGKALGEVALWEGGARPTLANSPDGLFLAVAGGPNHEIRLYHTAGGKLTLVQDPLESEGLVFRQVRFVRKDKSRGLLLNSQPAAEGQPPERGSLIFDVSGRQLADQPDGWDIDEPADRGAGKWETVSLPPDTQHEGLGFAVKHKGDLVGTVWLQKDQLPTARTLLPLGPFAVPILAVAFKEAGGNPYLTLWNVATGQQLRQLTGHVNPIAGLAFDKAGRRLASVGEDQTVCVWSLDDLDQAIGTRGMIAGLAVRKKGRGLEIARIDSALLNADNARALAGIEKGAAISKLVIDGKEVQPLATHMDFYLALWKCKPRERVVLGIGGNDVTFRIDQGIDEYKPLFSLFITGKGKVKQQWIGWSPKGPYDTGDPDEGERSIGWHTNTGKAPPEPPTEFAKAAEYRKDFYRDGILQYLLDRGNLPDALKEWERRPPAREPRTHLIIDGLDPFSKVDGEFLVQDPKDLTLWVEVTDIHPALVEKIEWQLLRDGQEVVPRQPFAGGKTGRLSVNLHSALKDWQRGQYTVRVLVTPARYQTAPYTTSEIFRYLPAPPGIKFVKEWIEKTFGGTTIPRVHQVAEPAFRLQAFIEPKGAQEARVTVRLNGKPIKRAGDKVEQELKLQKDLNIVEIEAVNVGAVGPLADYEKTVSRLVLYYTPDTRPPPVLSLLSIQSSSDPDQIPPAKGAVVISSRKVRVHGVLIAEDAKAAKAFAKVGDTEVPLRLAPADKGFEFDQELDLEKLGLKKPNKVEIEFQGSIGGRAAEAQKLLLQWKPLLPEFTLESPSTVEADTEQVDVVGQLTDPPDPAPVTARLFVNGQEVPSEIDMARRLRSRAPVRIQPGPNAVRVELQLENDTQKRTLEREILRKRPPRITVLRRQPPEAATSATFLVQVETARDLPLRQASLGRTFVENQQVALDKGDWKALKAADWKKEVRGDVEIWTTEIKDMTLEEGKNLFELRVANDEGRARQTVPAIGTKPPPPRPVVVFELPGDENVAVPFCPVRFFVRSQGPAQVTLFLNDRPVGLEDFKVTDERDGKVYKIDQFPLDKQLNTLRVVANDAGMVGEKSVIVTVVQPTVKVEAEGFRTQAGTVQGLDKPSETARGSLMGRVEWPDADDPVLRQPLDVRVWVNDMEQVTVGLDPAEGRVRRFRVPLCLSRPVNKVELRFPEAVKRREGDRSEFEVKCDNPQKRQRGHLLVVAPDLKEPAQQDKLTARVLKALRGEKLSETAFKSPAFPEGVLYKVDVLGPPSRLESILYAVNYYIQRRGNDVNEVVIVYFQGRLRMHGGKQYLLWKEPDPKLPLETYAIDCDQLRSILSDVKGAKLLLLDVQGDKAGVGQFAKRFPRISDLFYIWLGDDQDAPRRFLLNELAEVLKQSPLWGEARDKVTSARRKEPQVTVQAPNKPEGLNLISLGGNE
jgi:WD40 repeat protein